MAGPLRDPGPGAVERLRAMSAEAGQTDTGRPPEVEALPDAPVDAIEDWSLDQLHRRASEVDLPGRWEMSREELVAALREGS